MAPPQEEGYDYEALPPNFSLIQNLAAGAFAGIAEHTVIYPVDSIRTRMQILKPTTSSAYQGIVSNSSRVLAKDGVFGLWRGVSSAALGAGPAHALYFATYETVKEYLGGNKLGEYHLVSSACAGASATIVSDAVMNPFDVIKQRMQMHDSKKVYKSMFDCARYLYRAEGFRSFYVSYPATLATSVPHGAIQFTVYENVLTYLNPTRGYDPLSHCLCGALAGGIAGFVTTPTDVIKTMLQTRGNAADPELRNVKNTFEAFSVIKRREGLAGFFKGARPRTLLSMSSTSICWSAYEGIKAYFIAQNDLVV